MHVLLAGLLLCSAATTAPGANDDGEWISLFEGGDLEGWTQRNGTASYRIEDGAIVGRTTEGSPNSFLCTDRDFGNFELHFEVKVDDRLNSGVQIRSQTKDGPTGRVNGPQVEIEASGAKGAEAGYLYGEAAGGWMTPPAQRKPHKHFRDGEWNAYRVVAVGPRIQVWVNGEQTSDLHDGAKYCSHPRGFIGLQVHSIGKGQGPFEVRWRNLKLRELEDDFVDLFNGEDLTGWRTSGNWSAQPDGSLKIEPQPGQEGWRRFADYLWTEKQYGDFVLDLEYRYPKGGNSGVFFRVATPEDPVDHGIECQILDSSEHEGEMSHHDHGGIISTVGARKNMSRKPGEWNRMIVTCEGHRLQVKLNGEDIVDVKLDEFPVKDRPPQGHIGLQDHGVPHTLHFRCIRLKEL